MAACTNAPKATQAKSQDFSAVKGRVWQLAEVRNAAGAITFDSNKLDKSIFRDVYTLQFDKQLATGKGAPNRYTAPFTLEGGNGIAFKTAAATMMMAFREPEGLNEIAFFRLLEKSYKWELSKDKLVLTLHSLDNKGEKVSMIFNEFDYR